MGDRAPVNAPRLRRLRPARGPAGRQPADALLRLPPDWVVLVRRRLPVVPQGRPRVPLGLVRAPQVVEGLRTAFLRTLELGQALDREVRAVVNVQVKGPELADRPLARLPLVPAGRLHLAD